MIIDANVLIALCTREADKFAVAYQELTAAAQAGYQFFAPGVIVAECLYVLCKKQADGRLSPTDHADAVADLAAYFGMIMPSPQGDGALARRAEEIRGSYGCSRSADGIYIALTEALAATRLAELLTFDSQLPNQISRFAPTVVVRLLVPIRSGTTP